MSAPHPASDRADRIAPARLRRKLRQLEDQAARLRARLDTCRPSPLDEEILRRIDRITAQHLALQLLLSGWDLPENLKHLVGLSP